MSEVMTVESIIEAYYHAKGYLTKTRVPVKVKRNYSDIDVMAYDPIEQTLALCESKAHGSKLSARKIHIESASERRRAQKKDLFHFIDNVLHVLKNKQLLHVDFKKIKLLKVHFVNVHVFTMSAVVENRFRNRLDRALKKHGNSHIRVELLLHTHFDLLMELIKAVKIDTQGRRYGHPILDLIRELNRHLLTSDKDLQAKNREAIRDAFGL